MMKKYSKRNGIYSVIVITGSISLLGYFLYIFNTPKEISIALLGSIISLCAGFLPKFLEEEISEKKQNSEAKIQIYKNPFLIAISTYFLAISSVCLVMLYNFGVFSVIYGYLDPNDKATTIGMEVGVYVAIVTLPATVLISKYSCHRIKNHPLIWTVCAITLSKMTGVLSGVLLIPNDVVKIQDYALTFGFVILHFGATLIGHIWSEKSQQDFIVQTAFKQLNQSDRDKFIEIILKNPNKWKTTRRPHKK